MIETRKDENNEDNLQNGIGRILGTEVRIFAMQVVVWDLRGSGGYYIRSGAETLDAS